MKSFRDRDEDLVQIVVLFGMWVRIYVRPNGSRFDRRELAWPRDDRDGALSVVHSGYRVDERCLGGEMKGLRCLGGKMLWG